MTLLEYLDIQNLTCGQFGIQVDASKHTIQDLASGRRHPTTDLALRIVVATNGKVPLTSWVARGYGMSDRSRARRIRIRPVGHL